jgi:hypothetical protein
MVKYELWTELHMVGQCENTHTSTKYAAMMGVRALDQRASDLFAC